jgi:hypothetical protein
VVEIWGFPIPETHEGVEWSDAGALFHSEAERTAGSITFDDNERRALVELCRETDGLPLALVIAAEFTKTMSIQEILENVRRDIRFLESTRPSAEPRRNLHSVLDHAWGNVDGHAQEALRRLAVIQGNFDVDAARAIARVSHAELSMLRDACLLESLGPGVYRIPRLVRRHVWDTAPLETDELDELRARHAAFFARALSVRSYGLVRSTDTELPAYLPELDDLIAACEWAAATSQISVIVEIREGVALWCELTGRVEEGLQLLSRTESALAAAVDATPDDPILPSVLHHVRLAEARLLMRLGHRELAASKIPELDDGAANSSNDVATVRHLRRGEGALAAGDIRSATEHFGSALHMAMSSHAPVQAAVSSARLGAAFWRARQTRDSKNDEQPT